MIYSHMTYDIKKLFVCNLKQLGTKLCDDQQNIKFIMYRYDDDLGYECIAGRYGCTFMETITSYKIETIRSATEIPNPPYDTEKMHNAEEIDVTLFNDEEREFGYVSDLRLMQIYNTINLKTEQYGNKNESVENSIVAKNNRSDLFCKPYNIPVKSIGTLQKTILHIIHNRRN